MTGVGLQKYFTDVAGLHAHPFFKETGLKEDLAAGEVFPASELESQLCLSRRSVIIAQELVKRAISAGTRDNISVAVGICV